MATIQPRVQVCLDAETKALFDDTAKLMGLSTSRLIANLCVDSSPSVLQIKKFLESSKSGSSPLDLLKFAKSFAVEARQDISYIQVDLEDAIAAATPSQEPFSSAPSPKARSKSVLSPKRSPKA